MVIVVNELILLIHIYSNEFDMIGTILVLYCICLKYTACMKRCAIKHNNDADIELCMHLRIFM